MKIPLRIIGQDPPIPPTPPTTSTRPSLEAWLRLGFRPFFSLGSAWAVLSIFLWLNLLLGHWQFLPGLEMVQWHAHEMFFGFALAVAAGFLLTAVPNWTGIPIPRGGPLGLLVLIWLSGRVATWWGGYPGAVIDLMFVPALAFALGTPLIRAGELRNLVFLPVLGLLWLADLLFWAGNLGGGGRLASLGLLLALYGILTLVSLIGGRVIPFFAEKALSGLVPWRNKRLDDLCSIALPLCAVAESLAALPVVAKAVLLCSTGLLHGIRLGGWCERRVAKVPLLWILYLGYFFLPLGLLLKGLAYLGYGTPSAATHALTAGCIGIMSLGMMARVALGHSGRELRPAAWTRLAFVFIGLAAFLRSLVPYFWPSHYAEAIQCSGIFWCLAFTLFSFVYLPLLTRPRPDGKPG